MSAMNRLDDIRIRHYLMLKQKPQQYPGAITSASAKMQMASNADLRREARMESRIMTGLNQSKRSLQELSRKTDGVNHPLDFCKSSSVPAHLDVVSKGPSVIPKGALKLKLDLSASAKHDKETVLAEEHHIPGTSISSGSGK